jgi:mRNA-degrading endonuclease YafQ of YafQ-DinJ toxin-antitoxin module
MEIHYTREFLESLKKRDMGTGGRTTKLLKKKLSLLLQDKYHNGLRLHKVELDEYTAWSISLDMKIRVLFVYEGNDIVLVAIGSHEQVY